MEDKLKERYNQVFLGGKRFFKDTRIKQFTPRPVKSDYDRQVITRYFIQKANDKDAVIYEIDYGQKSKFLNNPTYSFAEIEWKVSGDSESKIIDSYELEVSVKQMNKLSINSVSHIIPNLKLYLPNLLQFYKK